MVLPDVLASGLRVVFCGTAVARASAERGAYYAGKNNRFWIILAESKLTPRRLEPEEFGLLPSFGIGLTDLAKHEAGCDAALSAEAFDRQALVARIRHFRPAILAFNGKKAAAFFLDRKTGQVPYGFVPGPANFPRLFVLPSTSGAAKRHWSPAPWFDLSKAVRLSGTA